MSSGYNSRTRGDASQRGGIRIRLTREGVAYGVVLMFVAAAAILRNINLLILLNGLMIGPLLMSWRVARSSLRRVQARRVVGPLFFAGRTESVYWQLENQKRLLPAWQVTVTDHASDRKKSGRKRMSTAMLLFREIGAGEAESSSYRVCFPRRGRYWLGPAVFSTSFPFGLIRASFVQAQREEVIVAPATGRLVTGWDRRLMSHAAGDDAVKRRSGIMGDEFFAVRPWRDGDSLKHLHWRSTARHNKPMVRQFDRRSDRDVILVLDLWQPAETIGRDLSASDDALRVELILSFASSVVAMAAREVHGRVTVAICGAKSTVEISGIEAKAESVENILRQLALAEASSAPDLIGILTRVAESTPGGTPVYVISSRWDRAEVLQKIEQETDPGLVQLSPWIRFLAPGQPEFDGLFTPPELFQRLLGNAAGIGKFPEAVSSGPAANHPDDRIGSEVLA